MYYQILPNVEKSSQERLEERVEALEERCMMLERYISCVEMPEKKDRLYVAYMDAEYKCVCKRDRGPIGVYTSLKAAERHIINNYIDRKRSPFFKYSIVDYIVEPLDIIVPEGQKHVFQVLQKTENCCTVHTFKFTRFSIEKPAEEKNIISYEVPIIDGYELDDE